jgi:hypothetical protein
LPALRDHEREHFISPFCGAEISGKTLRQKSGKAACAALPGAVK